MRILVTGGAGFIGSNLCHTLLLQGHTIIAIDNFITSSPKNLRILKKNRNFTFYKHDITKSFPKRLLRATTSIERIYHLACPTGVSNLMPLGEEMLLTCTLGTRNVLELAKDRNARVLFTSSSEVYGDPLVSPQKEIYTGNVETTGIRSVYEEGKRISESLVGLYVRKYNLDCRIVRVFNTYGPGMDLRDPRLIPHFLACLKRGKPVPVHGDGTQTRTFCYVDDLVSGIILAMEKGKKGEIYNLGSDKEYTILDVSKTMLRLFGNGSKMISVPRPPHDHRSRHPDLSKIKNLGWRRSVSLKDGLKKTFAWSKK